MQNLELMSIMERKHFPNLNNLQMMKFLLFELLLDQYCSVYCMI